MVSGLRARLIPGRRGLLLWLLLAAMVVVLAAKFRDLSLSYDLMRARRALSENNAGLAAEILERNADYGARSAEWQQLLARALRRANRLVDAENQLVKAKASGWNAE